MTVSSIWETAVGAANVEAGLEATPDTQYRIGSITKTFTAAAIMQLRDAGKLDLEDTLDRHVEGAAYTPTIRRLLSHASGLQRETHDDSWLSLRFAQPDELLETLSQAELVLPSGARFHYSNLAFALLGIVVERVSGMPYQDYVRERLFEPVGLTRVSFEPDAACGQGLSRAAVRRRRLGHDRRGDRRVGVRRPAVGDGRRHLPLGRVPCRSGRVRARRRRAPRRCARCRRSPTTSAGCRATVSASGCPATATGSSPVTAARCPASSRCSLSRRKTRSSPRR